MILGINCLPLHLEKAFFSTMQNKTVMETLLVSKSLPVVNSNSVNCSFSARKKKCCAWCNGMKYPLKFHTLLSSFSVVYRYSSS